MNIDDVLSLVEQALTNGSARQALVALDAVRKHTEICPKGTRAKLDALMEMEPIPEKQQDFDGKFLESLYDGFCSDCGTPYAVGELIWYQGKGKGVLCRGCRVAETAT